MPVVGIDDAQARFGCGGQVNGVSAPQKDGRRQLSNGVCARVSIVKPDQVTGIEVDHNPSCSRSSLIVFVESVPPRKYFRWARNARVNVGWAKNGLAGMGETGMILATKRPRSVT